MGDIVMIEFHGDQLVAMEVSGDVFVALRPIVRGLGIDWSSQLKRVRRDLVLSEGVVMMTTPRGHDASGDAIGLRLDLLNGWLFGIDVNRIKAASTREKVLRYQRECYRVLHDHFHPPVPGQSTPMQVDEVLVTMEKRQLVSLALATHGKRAARELWLSLELPVTASMLQQLDAPARSIKEDVLDLIGASLDGQLAGGTVMREMLLRHAHPRNRVTAALQSLAAEGRLIRIFNPSLDGTTNTVFALPR